MIKHEGRKKGLPIYGDGKFERHSFNAFLNNNNTHIHTNVTREEKKRMTKRNVRGNTVPGQSDR